MNYTEEEINLIMLSSFTELTYIQQYELLAGLAVSEPDFVKCKESLIKSLNRDVYNKVKADFYDPEYREITLGDLEVLGITCITYFSENYPEQLRRIDKPPIVLYCKGNLSLLNTECFAVVGSRSTLKNVLAECRKISAELTRRFTVVTGAAYGADAAALEGGLESGKIISVLAHGFRYFYPVKTKPLVEKVAMRGLLITEYPPEKAPQPYMFPIRNRIIAGLSRGVLVVSAAKKSGALITAAYAKEYDKELFAFPYGIGVTSGEGCNGLIKDGAKLTENTLDIFGQFGLDFKPQEGEKLPEDEEKLLAAIRELGDAFITDIAERLGLLPFQLIPDLSKLEIKGLIVRLGGNRYSAV